MTGQRKCERNRPLESPSQSNIWWHRVTLLSWRVE